METGYIYKIINPVGKIYIGQTSNIEVRKSQYRRLRCKGQTLLYNSIKKYGWENHSFEIVEICDIQLLDDREVFWIETLKVNYSKFPKSEGLNLTDGADGIKGYNHTSETKMKLSKKVDCYNIDGSFFRTFDSLKDATEYITGKVSKSWNNSISQAIKEKNKCFDKIWKYSTDDISIVFEIIENISNRTNGRFVKGQNYWAGKTHSEESKEKFRNRIYSKETRLKMSNSAKNRKTKTSIV